ncbi:MAG: 50S ribosomal protein L18a [Methanosarcinales archaeon]|nr:50S ribosomal protein L18a [Methanosarcinales archaeon]
MENYIISGRFKAGRTWEKFTKKVASQNEKNAKDKVYSLIGSEHNLKRNLIQLESTTKE